MQELDMTGQAFVFGFVCGSVLIVMVGAIVGLIAEDIKLPSTFSSRRRKALSKLVKEKLVLTKEYQRDLLKREQHGEAWQVHVNKTRRLLDIVEMKMASTLAAKDGKDLDSVELLILDPSLVPLSTKRN